MWIHGARVNGPRTLYPPTEEQFNSLVHFLLADSSLSRSTPCPLPIHATSDNRPRWSSYEAFANHHIFRDRFERKLPPQRPPRPCMLKGIDWPEVDDDSYIFMQCQARLQGKAVDEEAVSAAQARLRNITPSSPLWRHGCQNSEPRDND